MNEIYIVKNILKWHMQAYKRFLNEGYGKNSWDMATGCASVELAIMLNNDKKVARTYGEMNKQTESDLHEAVDDIMKSLSWHPSTRELWRAELHSRLLHRLRRIVEADLDKQKEKD